MDDPARVFGDSDYPKTRAPGLVLLRLGLAIDPGI
jgi:hypothetical protein